MPPKPTTPIKFPLCKHTSPPTPSPLHSSPVPPRCLPCEILTRRTNESLILEHYNGLINEQSSRLLVAQARNNTGRFDAELVAEGMRRMAVWRMKRDEEVRGVWSGLGEVWDGVKVSGARGGGEKEGRMDISVDGVKH